VLNDRLYALRPPISPKPTGNLWLPVLTHRPRRSVFPYNFKQFLKGDFLGKNYPNHRLFPPPVWFPGEPLRGFPPLGALDSFFPLEIFTLFPLIGHASFEKLKTPKTGSLFGLPPVRFSGLFLFPSQMFFPPNTWNGMTAGVQFALYVAGVTVPKWLTRLF